MKKILVVFLIILVPTTVFGQIDSGSDGIGVYFDSGATTVQKLVGEETLSVKAYLILTKPSLQGTLYYWEAIVETGCGDGFVGAEVTGNAVNAGNIVLNMPGQGYFSFVSNCDGYPPTELTSNVVVLAELEITGYFQLPVSICVREGAFYAESGESWLVMNPSSGHWDSPMAVINGPAPVPNESISWGRVKELFR